jgi:hypothetical protein
MHYEFPHLTDIDEVRRAIANANARVQTTCFVERDKSDEGYIVFDYVVSVQGLFPDLTGDPVLDRELKIIRECRGLLFDAKTGQVVARGLHKFFNVNERPETMDYRLDLSKPYVIIDKLDGSMLRPVRPFDKRGPNDPIHWGTMMGWTPIAALVDNFVNASELGYKALVYHCEALNMTPIFEWCSRKQPIVIDYPVDQLVLTAMRHNVTGEYAAWTHLHEIGNLFNVPVVKAFASEIKNLKEFIEYVRGIKNAEGCIIRWADGHMTKIKGDEYCFLHRGKEALQFEKDVIQMIVNKKVDDFLPSLDASDSAALTKYQEDFHKGVQVYADAIQTKVNAIRAQYPTKKDFFVDYVKTPAFTEADFEQNFYSKAYDNLDVVESMMRLIELYMHSGPRLDKIRHLWGNLTWFDYRKPLDLEV